MDKSVKKSIKLYLDGQQVSGSVNAIKAEVRKLTKEMNKLTIGTDEYGFKRFTICTIYSYKIADTRKLFGFKRFTICTIYSKP